MNYSIFHYRMWPKVKCSGENAFTVNIQHLSTKIKYKKDWPSQIDIRFNYLHILFSSISHITTDGDDITDHFTLRFRLFFFLAPIFIDSDAECVKQLQVIC